MRGRGRECDGDVGRLSAAHAWAMLIFGGLEKHGKGDGRIVQKISLNKFQKFSQRA